MKGSKRWNHEEGREGGVREGKEEGEKGGEENENLMYVYLISSCMFAPTLKPSKV